MNITKALTTQCEHVDVPFVNDLPAASVLDESFDVVVDAIFGYSFSGTSLRAPWDSVIQALKQCKVPIAAVDVPSGWDVDKGDIHGIGIPEPKLLVSLTSPKLCAQSYRGIHYLGGRFVPLALNEKYQLNLPKYQGSDQVVDITGK